MSLAGPLNRELFPFSEFSLSLLVLMLYCDFGFEPEAVSCSVELEETLRKQCVSCELLNTSLMLAYLLLTLSVFELCRPFCYPHRYKILCSAESCKSLSAISTLGTPFAWCTLSFIPTKKAMLRERVDQ